MYNIDTKFYHSFEKQFHKYVKENQSNKLLKKSMEAMFEQLKINPKEITKHGIHPLIHTMKGYWSIDTGLNSNADRCLYVIDDKTKTVFLCKIGDHRIYEKHISFNEYIETFI